MGLLGDITAYIDNLKRRGSNTLADLATNPLGLLSRNLSAFSESLPAAPDSVMPDSSGLLNRPGFQQWGMDVASSAPTMGLLGTLAKTSSKAGTGISLQSLKPIGDDMFSDTSGNVFRRFKLPNGNDLWSAGTLHPTVGWIPYAPEMKLHQTLDDAFSAIRSDKARSMALESQQKYSSIPNNWTGESRRIARKLIDNNIPVYEYSSSTQSKSKYIALEDGRKIRLSDHPLPSAYDSPDIEYRFGGDVVGLINKIMSGE